MFVFEGWPIDGGCIVYHSDVITCKPRHYKTA